HELALARVGLVRQPRLAVAVTRLLAIEALLPAHGNSIPAVAVLTPVVATLALMDVSFYDFSLATAPGAVFTPRHTTERLVDAALERLGPGPARIADVGTGAGAVAVAIALHRPRVEVYATDSSPAAVALAREN